MYSVSLALCLPLLLAIPGARAQLQWELIHDGNFSQGAPEARQDAGLGYDVEGHRVIMFAGRIVQEDGSRVLDDTWIYNIKDNRWRRLDATQSPGPPGRFSFVYGVTNGYFYVTTGQGINNHYLNDIWRFNFKKETWEELPSQPKPIYYSDQQWTLKQRKQLEPGFRYGAVGGIFPNSSRVYVSHGSADMKYADTLTYNVNDQGWFLEHPDESPYNPSYPHARTEHAGTMMSPNELLIYGGCLSGEGTGGPCPSSDSWVFHGKTKKWTKLSTCATARRYASLAMLPIVNGERRAILYGGIETGHQVLTTKESVPYQVGVFKPDVGEWKLRSTQGTNVPQKRSSASMATGKYGIYMFGGVGVSNGRPFNDLFLLRGDAMTADDAPIEADCVPPYFSMLILHGILMALGWGFFIQWGSFIARYADLKKPAWMHVYRLFQVFGLLIALAGFISGIISVKSHHFAFCHAIVGLVITILGLLQPINAIASPAPPKEGEERSVRRLLWEVVHAYLGRSALILALANISLGVFLAVTSSLLWILWFAYVGVLLLAYLIAECNRCYSPKPPAVPVSRPAGKYILNDKTNGLYGDKHNGYDNAALESEG